MRVNQKNGSMTVFFSVLSILFLSLACTLAESARVQGAKVKASAVLDMGLFSIFGEYERELLEEYDVFGIDASCGSGEFGKEKLSKRLDEFMSYNIEPGRRAVLTGDSLFPMKNKGSSILRTLLLTDEDGKIFRDQIIQNLKSAAGTELTVRILEATREAEKLDQAAKDYEEQEKAAERALIEAEKAEEERKEEIVPDSSGTEIEKAENPLDLIKKVRKMGILGIVMENPETVSQKTVEKKSLPSGRKLEKGDMTWEREGAGIIGEGIFLEYLFSHFSCALDKNQNGALSYELEYLLSGKGSDEENLKAAVNKLLLLREGVNFAYLLSDGEMRHSAELLAAAVSGGIPGLTVAIGASVLAAWAYGESLVDVKILLSGGKVPLVKSRATFRLTLENLGKILEVLKGCKDAEGEGLNYREYLQMLFLTGKKGKYPMRALDMIESNLRRKEGMSDFHIDHCAAGLESECKWEFSSVFAAVPAAFLDVGWGKINYKTTGKFIYEM